MKTFSPGGVHPEENKLTKDVPIKTMPTPRQVIIPLLQHLGKPAKVLVKPKDAVKKAKTHGIRDVDVYLRGPGSGKESAVRSIRSEGLNVKMIKDLTPTPHNGCRPRKRRRV